MVEVVGTAPTSVMVITKFVYRRSWKTNCINIKAFKRDSIKIMKITKKKSKRLKIKFFYSYNDNKLTVLNFKDHAYDR